MEEAQTMRWSYYYYKVFPGFLPSEKSDPLTTIIGLQLDFSLRYKVVKRKSIRACHP